MVSRTTFTGAAIGIFIYILQNSFSSVRGASGSSKIIPIFVSVTILMAAIGVYLYNTDLYYYELIRFAFEGFLPRKPGEATR